MTEPDPSQVTAEIAEILDQVDAIRAESGPDADPSPLDVSPLQAQADLFERAHSVLTDALEHLDHV